MMAAMFSHAYVDMHRDNANYKFTPAEERRFHRAWRKVMDRLNKLAEAHFDEDVYTKLYDYWESE